ncbi:MAG: succinyl-diaminopimelate desuccinylase [Propionibacteriales bacterium]|jgi:succinyl-diaminopimelate desuccinylase|nr:succinyl-diaminopimelate desuccinylase [Propionibacteriales bacterium]
MTSLDLASDIVDLTAALVDIESVSGNEKSITDAIEAALAPLPWLELWRHRHTLVARTSFGREERVVVAGHVDTVPGNDNLPARVAGDALHGLGSCDMKGGVAVALKLASSLEAPTRDLTYVFYEAEEVEADLNGLTLISAVRPDVLAGDFAVVMEPSNAVIEAGCQGTMRVDVTVRGVRAHAARSWNGVNAIHAATDVLALLTAYEPRRPVIDGLQYHEGLNAVGITGGVAGNVIPDGCTVSINHRFAPDRSEADAEAHLRELFAGFHIEVSDSAPGALPGLGLPAAAAFLEVVGGSANPKFGWTDVARFSAMGIPAVNFGPGNPELAHTQGEFVPLAHLHSCLDRMTRWLS